MTLHTLLAIDPGINGGLVLINFIEHTLQAWVMPTEPKNEHGQNRGRQVSPKGLMALAHAHGLVQALPCPQGTFLPSQPTPRPVLAPKPGTSHVQDLEWMRHVAALEDVYSMPRDGVVSAFTFGEGKGMIRMWLEAIHRPVTKISPAIWKRDLGLNRDKSIMSVSKQRTEAKARAIATAHKVFSGAKTVLSEEGICEAALIGVWVGAYHGMQGYDYGGLRPVP